MRLRRRQLCPTIVTAIVLLADGIAAHAAASDARAEIVLVGEPQQAQVLREAILDLLASDPPALAFGYRPVLDPAEILAPLPVHPHPLAARVWIDVAAPPAVRIYLADGSGRRFAARSLDLAPLDVAALETIAQIVRSSTRALLDPAAPALDAQQMRAQVETMARAAPPPARAPRPLAFEGRVSWMSSGPLADESLTHAAWFTAGLLGGAVTGARWWTWVGGGYGFPWSVEQDSRELGARLSLLGARAGLGVDVGLGAGPRLRARLGLGGGVDRLQVKPYGSAAGYQLAPAQAVTLGAMRGTLGLTLRLFGPVSTVLAVHGDWAPRARLIAEERASTITVSASRRLRPAIELGLAWEL